MKALINIYSLLILSTVFLACEQDEVSPDPVLDQEFFEASVTMWKTSGSPATQANTGLTLNLQLAGEGKSNLLSDITLENSHTEVFGDDPTSFVVENGKFLIKSVSGEEFYGTYAGLGTVIKGQVEIFETYQILGGTGKFTNATGTLSVQRNQIVKSNAFVFRSGTIATSISGTILLEGDPN